LILNYQSAASDLTRTIIGSNIYQLHYETAIQDYRGLFCWYIARRSLNKFTI